MLVSTSISALDFRHQNEYQSLAWITKMKINTFTEDTLISNNELTSARLSQIEFISTYVQARVKELSALPEFEDQIPEKIFRCHIVNYVRDNLFGKLNSKKIEAAIKRTNQIQLTNDRAEFLPYNDKFIAVLKELFVSSLFSMKQRTTERKRTIVYNDEMVDVKDLLDLPVFQFLNELIDLSYVVASSDAGYNTFNKSVIGQRLRSIPAKAGSLNLHEVKYHKQSAFRISTFFDFDCCEDGDCACSKEDLSELSPFTISNDDEYAFTVFFPNEELAQSSVLITNEERYESLESLEAKLPMVGKYNCFRKSALYVVNIVNNARSQGDAPVEVFEFKDGELVELSLNTPTACCMIDFSGVVNRMDRTFSLQRADIEE